MILDRAMVQVPFLYGDSHPNRRPLRLYLR